MVGLPYTLAAFSVHMINFILSLIVGHPLNLLPCVFYYLMYFSIILIYIYAFYNFIEPPCFNRMCTSDYGLRNKPLQNLFNPFLCQVIIRYIIWRSCMKCGVLYISCMNNEQIIIVIICVNTVLIFLCNHKTSNLWFSSVLLY